eukprot:gnl/Trimastix_PCT/1501.p1 GENE.gnl/Trimastix_PCT/1501~~gnl/Trimastix_PCT/1501.p1  ORF type:complete len:335 (+),score=76.56 gnl/Trimastix_PCT/1501:74-1006(+)
MSVEEYRTLLHTDAKTHQEAEELLNRIRELIIVHGLPEDGDENDQSQGIRGLVWKALLRITRVDASGYVSLVNKKASRSNIDIRDDTFRTLRGDKLFAQAVPEAKLIRVLNAYCQSVAGNPNLKYVQGMNVMCAPFLYVMPEVDAFFCFRRLLIRHCPNYVYPMLEGAHAGVSLLDEVLEVVDGELFAYLKRNGLHAKIYAFPLLMSFCGCLRPLDELLKIWDFLLAFGMYMNVPCAAAFYVLMRDTILASPRPMNILPVRYLPPLDARRIVQLALQMVQKLPPDLHSRLVRHPWDPSFVESCHALPGRP